ncbi:MAG TPA: peptidoglycan-binding protein, partial [Vicinamibacteria bacterium]
MRVAAALAFVLPFTWVGCGSPDLPAPEARTEVDQTIAAATDEVLAAARHPWLRWPDLRDVAPELRELYGAEPDRLFWFSGARPEAELRAAIESISRAEERGLHPEDYDAERIGEEWARLQARDGADARGRALFDVAVSVGILRQIDAVHTGRVDPRTLEWGYDVRPKKVERADYLRAARDGEGITILLNRLEPSYPHYVRNRSVLARYRELARKGEPAPVPPLPPGRRKIEPGDAWEGIPLLRARLRILGDLDDPSPGDSNLYEDELVEAVRRFQSRHILDPDGILGKATLEAVNVPLEHRVRQLELAMEKGRWLPELGD